MRAMPVERPTISTNSCIDTAGCLSGESSYTFWLAHVRMLYTTAGASALQQLLLHNPKVIEYRGGKYKSAELENLLSLSLGGNISTYVWLLTVTSAIEGHGQAGIAK